MGFGSSGSHESQIPGVEVNLPVWGKQFVPRTEIQRNGWIRSMFANMFVFATENTILLSLTASPGVYLGNRDDSIVRSGELYSATLIYSPHYSVPNSPASTSLCLDYVFQGSVYRVHLVHLVLQIPR